MIVLHATRVCSASSTSHVWMLTTLQRHCARASAKAQDKGRDDDGIGLILGAGGTARAAAYALKSLGLAVAIHNRTTEKV